VQSSAKIARTLGKTYYQSLVYKQDNLNKTKIARTLGKTYYQIAFVRVLDKLASAFITSFCLFILVAKPRNGSSSNDGRSHKERPLRRAPSVTGQEASEEGTSAHIKLNQYLTINIFLGFGFCFCFVLLRYCFLLVSSLIETAGVRF